MSLNKTAAGLTLSEVKQNTPPDGNNNDSTSKTKYVTLPPTVDRHKGVKSTNTVTVEQQSHSVKSTTNNSLQSKSAKDQSTLSANKLSQENLLKLKQISGPANVKKRAVRTEDTGYDTDDEKEHRIVQWLIGVENCSSDTEQPPDIQEISTNEKRDTAIHIVYEGD